MEHSSSSQALHAQEGICVAIRMRPLNDRELACGQDAVFRCSSTDNRISQLKENQVVEGQTYSYDKVFNEKATTAEVYTHVGRDAVKNVAAGINGTIFACMYITLYKEYYHVLY